MFRAMLLKTRRVPSPDPEARALRASALLVTDEDRLSHCLGPVGAVMELPQDRPDILD